LNKFILSEICSCRFSRLCFACCARKYRKRRLVSQANLENRDILFHQASLARLSNIFCPFSLTSPGNFSIYLGAAYLQKERKIIWN
jgi:Golgi nucleoside diphosphatase